MDDDPVAPESDFGPASAAEVAEFAGHLASQLALMCEAAGLAGLAVLFSAAGHEATRVQTGGCVQGPKAAAGNAP